MRVPAVIEFSEGTVFNAKLEDFLGGSGGCVPVKQDSAEQHEQAGPKTVALLIDHRSNNSCNPAFYEVKILTLGRMIVQSVVWGG
jgi:hypothetical protein